MPWKEGDGTPYDGYYNGNVKLMIANGTYDDYRPALLDKAQRGKLWHVGDEKKRIEESMKKIEMWDREWAEVPLQEKILRRSRVVEEVTPKMITEHTVKGPVQRAWSTPSENNNAAHQNRKGGKPKLRRLQPVSGSIASMDNPLVATPA